MEPKKQHIMLRWLPALLLTTLWGCEKTEPTIGPETRQFTVTDVRGLTATGTGLIPDGYKVNAVVISNREIEDENLVYVQSQTSGMGLKVRFDGRHNFRLGDYVECYVAGSTIRETDGEYEITDLPLVFTNRLGNATIEPRVTTAAEAIANFMDWSSSLVTLKAMKVAARLDGATYELRDSLGSATIRVSVDERLGLELPDSVQFITGILTRFGGSPAVRIRTAGDVLTYSPEAGEQTILETFDVGGEGSYANGDRVFTGFVSGDWMFNDASVLGTNEVNDLRNGAGSVRLRGQVSGNRVGYIYTLFDVKGLKRIRFLFGGTNLGEGGAETGEYSAETFISKDGGASWVSLGKKVGKRGEFTLMEYDVDAAADENVRVKIQNTSNLRTDGNRVRANVDDVELIN